MPEQHVQLLTGLGFSKEQVDQIEAITPDQMKTWKADDPEALKIFNPNELVTVVHTGLKNKLSNDPEFLKSIPEDKINPDILKKIEKGQYARFQNELEDVAIKQLGLDKNDLTEEDKKSIKGYVNKLATVYATKKGSPEGLQAMQAKLSETLQAMEALKTEHGNNLKTEIEKVTGANTMKLIKTLTKVELAGLEDVKLGVAPQYLSEPVLAVMNSKYTVVLDANDNIDIKQKDHPTLDVLDKAGKKITFAQALKEEVIANKLGAEIKEDDPEKKKKKKILIDGGGDDGGGDPVIIDSHIAEKIAANK